MTTKELIEYADKFNRDELKKYNYDLEPMYAIALKEGKRLAKIYDANEEVVLISLALIDAKLPEAVRLGTPKEHTNMGILAANDILSKVVDMSDEMKINIIKCIEEHHGSDSYYSKESEVVANSDCYKFLSPKGIITYISILGRRLNDFEKEWDQLENKMDEKIKLLSLDVAKQELTPCYETFKKYLEKCRKD